MPFALGFQIYPWIERILRVRRYPLLAYGLALAMVALAVLVRGVGGQYASAQVFTTFYPAIIVAALVGGLWPGIFATVLSAIAPWSLILPRFLAWHLGERQTVEFVLFLFISCVDVAIAVVVSKLVERLVIQQLATFRADALFKSVHDLLGRHRAIKGTCSGYFLRRSEIFPCRGDASPLPGRQERRPTAISPSVTGFDFRKHLRPRRMRILTAIVDVLPAELQARVADQLQTGAAPKGPIRPPNTLATHFQGEEWYAPAPKPRPDHLKVVK